MQKPYRKLETLVTEWRVRVARSLQAGAGAGREIEVLRFRIKEAGRLWKTMQESPCVRKMATIVDGVTEKNLASFYLQDLKFMSGYVGRFAWWVGPDGTHHVRLENESAEWQDKAWRAAATLQMTYVAARKPAYRLYIVDRKAGTVRRAAFTDLEFTLQAREATMV